MTIEMVLVGYLFILLLLFIWLWQRFNVLDRKLAEQETLFLPQVGEMLEQKQRQLAHELHGAMRENSTLLATSVENSMKGSTDTLNLQFDRLTHRVDQKLEQISGRVNERLDKGFEKTQKVFADVLMRLSTIDEAQKRIDQLSQNVVSLQDILTDKRSRGAFGEVQLTQLVRQVLPESVFEFQVVLSNNRRADCLLKLPDPINHMVIDAKFPLENYQLSLDDKLSDMERRQAATQFRQDMKKHINDIAGRYIIPNETADSAMMFLPSEAVFAELHAHYPDVVALAQQRRVWIASPTTMMAILTTVAAALKDIETRKQLHIIQSELGKLAEDFSRFGQRFDKLAVHIRQAHEDTQQIHTSARKISQRFERIEKVELQDGLDGPEPEHA